MKLFEGTEQSIGGESEAIDKSEKKESSSALYVRTVIETLALLPLETRTTLGFKPDELIATCEYEGYECDDM